MCRNIFSMTQISSYLSSYHFVYNKELSYI